MGDVSVPPGSRRSRVQRVLALVLETDAALTHPSSTSTRMKMRWSSTLRPRRCATPLLARSRRSCLTRPALTGRRPIKLPHASCTRSPYHRTRMRSPPMSTAHHSQNLLLRTPAAFYLRHDLFFSIALLLHPPLAPHALLGRLGRNPVPL